MSSIIHIFNRPISVIVMRLIFETEYTPRAVVRLGNICIWLEGKRLPDMTPNRMMLDVSVPPHSKKIFKIIHLILIRLITIAVTLRKHLGSPRFTPCLWWCSRQSRENRRGNQEKLATYWVHKKQDKDKQNKKHNTKRWATRTPP
jgi:hypothetical protein